MFGEEAKENRKVIWREEARGGECGAVVNVKVKKEGREEEAVTVRVWGRIEEVASVSLIL